MKSTWQDAAPSEAWYHPLLYPPFLGFLNGDRTAAQTAEALFKAATQGHIPQSDGLWRVWTMMLHATAELPDQQPKILESLLEFQALISRQTKERPDEPEFGWVWRDEYDELHPRRGDSGSSHSSVSNGEKWVNFNAFTARLAAARCENFGPEWGLVILRDALESTQSNVSLLRVDIIAATRWICYAGDTIRRAEASSLRPEWRTILAKETDRWKEGLDFSAARWAFWRSRLEEIVADEGQDDEVKAAASEAVQQMQSWT